MGNLVVTGTIVLVGAALLAVAWMLLGWPPPLSVLRYWLKPGCEPTGRKRTVEGVTFVEIGPGAYRMGSAYGEGGDLLGRICGPLGLPWGKLPGTKGEMLVLWVKFRRGFWIAETEHTNEQYERFDPQHERGEYSLSDGHPVVDVSWDDAKRYCSWVAEKSGIPVRLPSESEWECGHRGESSARGAPGMRTRGHDVGKLRDLHENVQEWCEDTYHEGYEGSPVDGSAWTDGGEKWEGSPLRVVRGGNWLAQTVFSRLKDQAGSSSNNRDHNLGFRPAFSPSDP